MKARFTLGFVVAALGLPVFAPIAVQATPGCADGMLPAPAITGADHNKDRNNNGVVCKRVNPNGVAGGPDDTFDDRF